MIIDLEEARVADALKEYVQARPRLLLTLLDLLEKYDDRK